MFNMIRPKEGWDIDVRNISRLSLFFMRLFTVLVFLLFTGHTIAAQDTLTRMQETNKQIKALGEELKSCGADTECMKRVSTEMLRLIDLEYSNKISDGMKPQAQTSRPETPLYPPPAVESDPPYGKRQEIQEINEQIKALGEGFKNCGDDECIQRIKAEMARLAKVAGKLGLEEVIKGSGTVGSDHTVPPSASKARRYSFESELRCEYWIEHVEKCLEARDPEIRKNCFKYAAKRMCLPVTVTIRDRFKSSHLYTVCDRVLYEFYLDYKISAPGLFYYSSDFSEFSFGVPINSFFKLEIDQAHGFSLEVDRDNTCSTLGKRNFTKSDIVNTNRFFPPNFELKFKYPTENKRLNVVYNSRVFLNFAGYDGRGLLNDDPRHFSESNTPEISYLITPEIIRRALSEKRLQHTFHLSRTRKEGQYHTYRESTTDMDIQFGPLDCFGDKNDTAGSVAFSGACTDDGGIVIGRIGSVFGNGRPIARVGEPVFSTSDGVVEIVGKQDCKVFVEGKPIARVGDVTTKGARIIGGSKDIFIGQ